MPRIRRSETATPSTAAAVTASPETTSTSSGAGSGAAEPAPVKLVWHNEKRRISDLIEWEKNPRQLSEAQARQLGESIRKFGFVEPVAINLDRTIIGGHMRRRVLQMQALVNPDAEIDVRVPNRMLTEDEFEELAIRLNRNQGEWDFDRLANWFDQEKLLEWGFESWEFGLGDDSGGADAPGEFKPIDVETKHKCPKCGFLFD